MKIIDNSIVKIEAGECKLTQLSPTFIELNECTEIGDDNFLNCEKLEVLNLPRCQTIGNSFQNLKNLKELRLPKCPKLKALPLDSKIEVLCLGSVEHGLSDNTNTVNEFFQGQTGYKNVKEVIVYLDTDSGSFLYNIDKLYDIFILAHYQGNNSGFTVTAFDSSDGAEIDIVVSQNQEELRKK